ncbi:MAG: glutaminyl-peptide cyclotransferase [Gemmatimonadaceae bacterium]|nr:glutaminyl-peptide cyclotransferase [Gemmatimonadaceae bacterium]
MPRLPLLCLLGALAACNGADADASPERPALPPGMLPGSQLTNADAPPPSVPFESATPRYGLKVLRRHPHDTDAYTQGLVLMGNRLLESVGRYGQSDVREVTIANGGIARRTRMDDAYFGEGLAAVGNRLYQLTWRAEKGFVYDGKTLAVVDSFAYRGEGWGLASDGQSLFISDGSPEIRVLSLPGYAVTRTIRVTEGSTPVPALNELEFVDGELWANVYQTRWIARIDPASGAVKGWIDTDGILTAAEAQTVNAAGGVPNGIAYDAASKKLYVTGKLWPVLAQVEVTARR